MNTELLELGPAPSSQPTTPPLPAEIATRLDSLTRIAEAREERRADLAEVVEDLMPVLNGLVVLARDHLDRLERSGALATLAEAGRMAQAVAAATPPEEVRRLGESFLAAAPVLGELTSPELLATAQRTLAAVRGPVEPVGAWGLLRALREPEVARGVGVLLSLLRALGTTSRGTRAAAEAASR